MGAVIVVDTGRRVCVWSALSSRPVTLLEYGCLAWLGDGGCAVTFSRLLSPPGTLGMLTL